MVMELMLAMAMNVVGMAAVASMVTLSDDAPPGMDPGAAETVSPLTAASSPWVELLKYSFAAVVAGPVI